MSSFERGIFRSDVLTDPEGAGPVYFFEHTGDTQKRANLHATVMRAMISTAAESAQASSGVFSSQVVVALAASTQDDDCAAALRCALRRPCVLRMGNLDADLTVGYVYVHIAAVYATTDAAALDWDILPDVCWRARVFFDAQVVERCLIDPVYAHALPQSDVPAGTRFIEAERNNESLYVRGFGDHTYAIASSVERLLGSTH